MDCRSVYAGSAVGLYIFTGIDILLVMVSV